jgi:ferredoxin
MAYKVTDDCITCGACEVECKNQAISEGETIYVIDPAKCTECVGNFASPNCARCAR